MAQRRPDRKRTRQKEAQERQEAWESLSVAQRIQSLDERLGVGEGAEKQRRKLEKALRKEQQK